MIEKNCKSTPAMVKKMPFSGFNNAIQNNNTNLNAFNQQEKSNSCKKCIEAEIWALVVITSITQQCVSVVIALLDKKQRSQLDLFSTGLSEKVKAVC